MTSFVESGEVMLGYQCTLVFPWFSRAGHFTCLGKERVEGGGDLRPSIIQGGGGGCDSQLIVTVREGFNVLRKKGVFPGSVFLLPFRISGGGRLLKAGGMEKQKFAFGGSREATGYTDKKKKALSTLR